MNDGVKILLERMETHPEEFIGEAGFAYSKWGSLIGAYKEHLEVEDRVVLTDALCKLHQQAFTEKVMEELVDPKKSGSWAEKIIRERGTPSVGTTPSPYMDKATIEHMKIHLDALKLEVVEEKKKHTTMFGKLFNYQ